MHFLLLSISSFKSRYIIGYQLSGDLDFSSTKVQKIERLKSADHLQKNGVKWISRMLILTDCVSMFNYFMLKIFYGSSLKQDT